MTRPEMLEPPGIAPPLGQYSHASAVPAGPLVFVAGQVATDEDGDVVGKEDLAEQARQVFRNLQRVLAVAGADLSTVAKFTTFLARAADIPTFFEVRRELFAEHYPDGRYPPNTLVVVDRLVSPEFLIEIEAIATR